MSEFVLEHDNNNKNSELNKKINYFAFLFQKYLKTPQRYYVYELLYERIIIDARLKTFKIDTWYNAILDCTIAVHNRSNSLSNSAKV